MTAMKYSFVSVGIWWALFSQYSSGFLPKVIGGQGYRIFFGMGIRLKLFIKLKPN